MKNKVLIISYYFNKRNTDRAFAVWNYFMQAGYDVKVLCGNFDHNSKSFVEYNLPGVVEIPVLEYKKNMSVDRIASYIKFAMEVKHKIKKMDFDIGYIIGPPNSTGYLLYDVVKSKKAVFVTDIYDLYPETIPVSERMKKLLKYVGFGLWSYLRDATIAKADVFIGSCQYYFTRLKIMENQKNHMVPLCKGEALVESPVIPETDILNFVYLGALTGNYDFESLVKIMKGLKDKGAKAHLDIIGEGDKKEWLLSNLESEEIEYSFHGRIYDDQEKLDIMGKCQFGYNGFKKDAAIALSYKSMEYMSMGLALLNSCKEDTWELVESERIGINFDSDNIEACVDSIIQCSASEIDVMRKASLSAYNNKYAWHNYCKMMDEIFEKIKCSK